MADNPYDADPLAFIRFAQQVQPAAAPTGVPAASHTLTPGTPATGGSMGPAHAALQQRLGVQLGQGNDIQSLLQSLIANPQAAAAQYGMNGGAYTPDMPAYQRVDYNANAGPGGLLQMTNWGSNPLLQPSLAKALLGGTSGWGG